MNMNRHVGGVVLACVCVCVWMGVCVGCLLVEFFFFLASLEKCYERL